MPRPEAEMAVEWRDPEPTPTVPIVLGGQGRTTDSVEFDGKVVAWFLLSAVVTVLVVGALLLAGVL